MENQPYHHGNLRTALIEAGIDLIGREGIHQLSLRKVASLCGVSAAAPYAHFKNKEELLGGIKDHITEQFMTVLQDAINSAQNQDDPELLIEMGKRYILFFIDHPAYYPFIFYQNSVRINLDLSPGEEAPEEDPEEYPPFQIFKVQAVRILKKQGLDNEKIENAIISMWSTVHGLASIATMKDVRYSKEWRTKIEDIITSR